MLFKEATDCAVLNNCALVLTYFAKGEHSRTSEALLCLRSTASFLRDRVIELIDQKADPTSMADGEDAPEPHEIENSISLCLTRLVVLAKRFDIVELLTHDLNEEVTNEEVESLFDALSEHLVRELSLRRAKTSDDDNEADTEPTLPEIWQNNDPRLHLYFAETAGMSLSFMLLLIVWIFKAELARNGDDKDGGDFDSKPLVVKLRDKLVKLLVNCCEQYAELEDCKSDESAGYKSYCKALATHALNCCSDLQSFFSQNLQGGRSSFLRACSLPEDSSKLLASCNIRHVANHEKEVSMPSLMSCLFHTPFF